MRVHCTKTTDPDRADAMKCTLCTKVYVVYESVRKLSEITRCFINTNYLNLHLHEFALREDNLSGSHDTHEGHRWWRSLTDF